MAVAAKLSAIPDFAERRRLEGGRGSRANCINCGSFVTLPVDAPIGYGGSVDHQFDCPNCRSLYSLDSADHHSVNYELAVVQNEHRGARVKRSKPARNDAYRDPIYGAVRRADDRLSDAQRALEHALYVAHTEHGHSYRTIAQNTGRSKSQVEILIRRERERVGNRKPGRADHAPALAVVDDFPF